jgi:hypothetical protein
MDVKELQNKLNAALGLHVGEQMAAYVLAKFAGAKTATAAIPILAQDARTGHPIHRTVTAADLEQPQLF